MPRRSRLSFLTNREIDATAKKTNQTSAKPASSKETRAKPEAKVSKLSALEAAAKVLSETKKALSAQEMIDAMKAQGYWTSPKGKTPSATLYAALTREIKIKGNQARFQKASPGHFRRRFSETDSHIVSTERVPGGDSGVHPDKNLALSCLRA